MRVFVGVNIKKVGLPLGRVNERIEQRLALLPQKKIIFSGNDIDRLDVLLSFGTIFSHGFHGLHCGN